MVGPQENLFHRFGIATLTNLDATHPPSGEVTLARRSCSSESSSVEPSGLVRLISVVEIGGRVRLGKIDRQIDGYKQIDM